MTVSLDDMIAGLDPERQRRIEVRAEELIAEEMTLRELREARKLTQVSVARELGISQDAISRLERRSDLLLSTLRRTVKAVGGSLSLIARFPDRALRYRRARRPRLTPPRRTPPILASGSRFGFSDLGAPVVFEDIGGDAQADSRTESRARCASHTRSSRPCPNTRCSGTHRTPLTLGRDSIIIISADRPC